MVRGHRMPPGHAPRMSVLTMLGVFAFNGLVEVLLFFVRDFAVLILCAFALLFSRWEIAEDADSHEGVGESDALV